MAASISRAWISGFSKTNFLKVSLRTFYTQSYRSVRCSTSSLLDDRVPDFFDDNETTVNARVRDPPYIRGKIPPLRSLILEKKLNIDTIDFEVRKKGRIYSHDVESIFTQTLNGKLNIEALSRYCLFLIRCCGNLMPDLTPENKTNLAHKMWNKLKHIDVHLDIVHYNALLKVYNQNYHELDQNAFLNEVKQRNLEPNRVTYQCLIANSCMVGDIERATKLLATMQEKNMALTESIFEALIIGHARAGDLDSAKGIPDIMRKFNLKPGFEISTALMIACAESGDIDGTIEVWQKIPDEGFQTTKPLLSLIESLVNSGKQEQIPEIMKAIKTDENSVLFDDLSPTDIANTVRNLLYKGQYHTASLILSETNKEYYLPRLVFVSNLFKTDNLQCPEELTWEYVKQFAELFPNLYEIALSKMVKTKFYPDLTSKIIDEIKAKNVKVSKSTINSIVKKCLFENQLKLATYIAKNWKIEDEDLKSYLSFHLKKYFYRNRNAKEMAEFIEVLLRDKVDSKKEMTMLVVGFLDSLDRSSPSLERDVRSIFYLFNQLNDKGFKIYGSAYLVKRMRFLNLPNLNRIICRLIDPESLKNNILVEKDKGKKTELQNILVAVHGLNKDYKEAHDLKEEILSSGSQLSSLAYLSLIYAASVTGHMEAVLEFSKQFPNQDRRLFFVITDAIEILAKENQLENAVELIRKFKGDYPDLLIERGKSSGNVWPSCVARLANNGRAKEAQTLVDLLIKEGYQATNFTFGTIIAAHIKRKDIESAIAYLEHTSKMYKMSPGFSSLVKEAIKVKDQDPQLLERVLKCNTYPKMQLQTILGFSYLVLGHLKEARNILRDAMFSPILFKEEMDRLINLDKTDVLQNLISNAKLLRNADMDEIYFLAIGAYGKRNDWKKCLEMWNDMQADDVLPRSRTLIYLAEILQKNEQPVPFYVPLENTM